MVQTLRPYPYLAPQSGLRFDLPADLITDLEMSDCHCVRIKDGHICKWPGTRRMGDNLPLSGGVMGMDLFTMFSGQNHFLAGTNRDLYRYNTTTGCWETVTKSTQLEGCDSGWTAGTGVTVTHDDTVKIRETHSLKMTLSSGRSDGDQLAYKDISSADASAHNSIGFWIRSNTTLAANALEIVVSESNHASGEKTGTYVECLTTALTADTWTFVRLAKTLTSFNAVLSVSVYANASLSAGLIVYLDDLRAYTPLTGDNNDYLSSGSVRKNTESDLWWITTNGVDPIQKYTGSGVCSNLIASYPTGLTSLLTKYVLPFKNHVLLLNVTEEGNVLPQRVRWSDSGVPDDYINGNASYADLNGAGAIVGGLIYKNDYVFIPRTDSIWVGSATGDTDIFAFDQVSNAIGTPCGRTARNVEDNEVLFVGRHNLSKVLDVYSFSGTGIVSVGKPIRSELADTMNLAQIDRAFAFMPHDNKEYVLVVPGSGDTYCDTLWIFNYELRTWTRGSLSDYINCAAWWDRQTSIAWSDLVGSWEDQNWRWVDASPVSGSPITILADPSGYVYEFDPSVYNDDVTGDNSGINGWFSSKDIALGGMNTRQYIARIDVQYRGSGLSIDYSTDGGQTWTTGTTLAAQTNFDIAQTWWRIDSNKARFRFGNADDNGWFEFREARIWWRPAGRRLV